LGELTDSTVKQIACIFPGQGSQYVGMAKVLCDEFPWTKEVYEEASEAVKDNLLKLSLEGPDDVLQLTYNAQPCILVTSYAWFRVLSRELDFKPSAAAGHSLGEYTALLASGALRLNEAVTLVRKRGELMQKAVAPGKGKMAAVIGLEDDQVSALCEKASERDSLVVPANFNAPMQVVIAGNADAVDRAEALTKTEPSFKARKFIPLKVSAPFHCPLMESTARSFEPFLGAIAWQKMAFPIVFNVDAKMRMDGELKSLLKDQIDHPVLWTSCVKTLYENGHATFVEPGPGRVLTGMVKRILDEVKTFSVDSVDGLKELEHDA